MEFKDLKPGVKIGNGEVVDRDDVIFIRNGVVINFIDKETLIRDGFIEPDVDIPPDQELVWVRNDILDNLIIRVSAGCLNNDGLACYEDGKACGVVTYWRHWEINKPSTVKEIADEISKN